MSEGLCEACRGVGRVNIECECCKGNGCLVCSYFGVVSVSCNACLGTGRI